MPAGAPGTGIGSPGGGRLLCRRLAPGLAVGVPRGVGFLPGSSAILRGWERDHARRGPGDGNGFL